MTKTEFLEKLSEALRENMDDRNAYSHITYYSDYIDSEVKKGKSEKEVVESLGNPRLIAKSIIDSGTYAKNTASYTSYDSKRDEGTYGRQDKVKVTFNGQSIGGFEKIMAIIIAIVIIAVVIMFVVGVAKLIIKLVIPVLIIILLFMIAVNILKNKTGS